MDDDSKIKKYEADISEQEGVSAKAKIMAALDSKFELYQGKIFVRLDFNEHSSPEQTGFGVTDSGDRFSGLSLYCAGTRVMTGVFNKIGYEKGSLNIESKEGIYEWEVLYLYNGPKNEKYLKSLPLSVQIIQTKCEKDGILVWNGILPVAYRKKYMLRKSHLSSGHQYAPDSLSKKGISSIAIVIGNEAVAKLFDLEKADEIKDTRTLYQALLKQEKMNPEILANWSPDNMICGDYGKSAKIFNSLEKRIEKIPAKFFEEDIFEYGIEKPEGYNMNFEQQMEQSEKDLEKAIAAAQ